MKYGVLYCVKCRAMMEIIYICPDGVKVLKCDHMTPDPREIDEKALMTPNLKRSF